MAMDMFIKIDGLAGESVDKTHRGEIDVLAWNWGAHNAGSTHVGGGGGSGKVRVQDLSFTKYVDKSSPDLLLACCNGRHADNAVLVVRKAGESPLEYLSISMSEVLVSQIASGGTGEDDRLTETVSLNFAAVRVEYVEQSPQGGSAGRYAMSWNIAENAS